MPKDRDDEFEDDAIEYSDSFDEEARKAGLDPNGGELADDESEDEQDDESEDEQDDAEGDDDAGDDESGGGSDDGAEDAPDDDAAARRGKSKKKKMSAEERIRELARAREESERAAYRAEMEFEEYRRANPPRQDDDDIEIPPAPDPKDFRYGELDDGYINAMVDHRVAKKRAEDLKADKQRREQETQQEAQQRYKRRLDEVMAEGTKKYTGFREAIQETVFAPDLARQILDSDSAVDLAYHLSKNIRDLRDLTRASPEERARKLGKLEGKLSATSAAKKRKSNAPKTPGKKRDSSRSEDRSTGKYGPADQDEFDKAFFGR